MKNNHLQFRLEELLKKKGIGPQGSKSLNKDELEELKVLFHHDDVSKVTKAAMLTALLTLEPTEEEKEFLSYLHLSENNLPEHLLPFIEKGEISSFQKIINKVIRRNDLSEEESTRAMDHFFDSGIPEFQKAAFLEAERLKRESFVENKSFFSYLWKKSRRLEFQGKVLIDIADSYDGSNRTRNYSLFTAALLASAGFPVIVHGIDEVAPKFGHSSHQILKEAGKDPLLSMEKAMNCLSEKEISWCYLDQQVFFPELYQLKSMRKEMVKRPFLATFEKLLQPIRSVNGNYIVTGYTHAHYKDELVKQLKEQNMCASTMVLRGMEGSTHISMNKSVTCMIYDGNKIKETAPNPADFGFPMYEEKQDKSVTAKDSYQEGLIALEGSSNYAAANILYLAIVIISNFRLMDTPSAIQLLETNLKNGKAKRHWENFINC
ncbi:MAG: anthranilate phosphoribosyltransferase [Cytophagaceae bacterium]